MNNRETQYLEDHWRSIRPNKPNKLRVVMIYETVVDGMRAKRFSDQVVAKVDNGHGLDINVNAWSLGMLEVQEILNLAGVAAATADIVIISVTHAQSLPRQLKDWIRMWTSLVKDSHPFVAALFSKAVNGNATVHEEMRRVAMREGVQLFSWNNQGNNRAPVREKWAPGSLVESVAQPTPPPKDQVLVVDDDYCSSVLAGKMLQLLGYHPDFASNGVEAVDSFSPGKYLAILMDVTMPVMDGLDATKAILEIETVAGGHVPIIAMTANVMPGDCERCLAAGMDDFLAKPFKKDELAAKMAWSQRHCSTGNGNKSDCCLEETV